jgi:hypothetical protein
MNDIIEGATRKDKFSTPNLQGKGKIINKLSGAAYSAVNH